MRWTMKRWLSILMALVFVLSLGTVTAAEGEDPVGIVSGNAYYNEALGISFAPPAPWRIYDDGELAKACSYDSQYASRDGLNQLLSQKSFVTAMMAEASDNAGTNANLVVQDLGIYRSLDEQTYFAMAKSTLTQPLESQGYTDLTLTEGTFQLAGKDHVGATVTGSMGLMKMSMIYVMIKGDRYMGLLCVASLNEENAKAALAYFVPMADLPVAAAAASAATTNPVHDQIAAAIAKEDWAGALKLLDGTGGSSYPDFDAVRQNCQNHVNYAKAVTAMDNKLYYTAYQLFTEMGNFENAAQLAQECIQTTPKSKQLSRNQAYKRKTVRIYIKNRLSKNYNVYLRFYDVTGNTRVCGVFIRYGQEATIYLPDDSYLVFAAFGSGPWFGDDALYKIRSKENFTQVGRNGLWNYPIKNETIGNTITRYDFK